MPQNLKLKYCSFVSLICAFLMLSTLSIYANPSSSSKTIRVGFPIQESLTTIDENGNLSGYTYDYLMEISQYTGWNYDFVFIDGDLNTQLVKLMDMLENGEIDILGTMYYNDDLAEKYAYSGYCYGINYMGLYVPEDSELRESSLYNLDHIKVAVYNRSGKSNPTLTQFAQMNNLNIEQVIVTEPNQQYALLDSGKADAVFSTDLAMASAKNMYSVVHFSPNPFYFTTTKGNTDVVQGLNYALSTIDQVNPDFMAQLYNQYFSNATDSVFFSKNEKEFIANSKPLNIVIYNNKPPFQYIDPKTNAPTGVAVEILNYISDVSGLTFNFYTASTYDEYMSFIESGQANIAADILSNYQDAMNIDSTLSLPWLSSPISIIIRSDSILDPDGIIAVPYSYKNIIPTRENVVFYDTIKECLDAVQSGSANHSYVDEFSSQYYFNSKIYDDLQKIHQSDIETQKISFGILNNNDLALLSIFNKCISSIPKDTINEISYRNTYKTQDLAIADFIKVNRNLIVASFFTIFSLLLVLFLYSKNRKQQHLAFENKRYNALSTLSNEYFYEYNVLADELTLSLKLANSFGCEDKITHFSKKIKQNTSDDALGIFQLGQYILSPNEGTYEVSCMMNDNSRRWFKLTSTNISNKKQQVYSVGKIVDIQDIKSEQIRLEHQASIDGLTEIYNITAIKNLIQQHLDDIEQHKPCAMLILDIDDFKHINDTFGHYAGDKVLVQTANIISDIFDNSLVGRLGGDEFVIFAQNINKTSLEEKCKLLIGTIKRKTHKLLGAEYSLSIGISWADSTQSYEDLYKKADSALYKSKSMGKNGYSFFE